MTKLFHPNEAVAVGEARTFVAFDPGGSHVYIFAAGRPKPVERKLLAPSEVEAPSGGNGIVFGPHWATPSRCRRISPCLRAAA